MNHLPINKNYDLKKEVIFLPIDNYKSNKGLYYKLTYYLKNEELQTLINELDTVNIRKKINSDCILFIDRNLSKSKNPCDSCIKYYPTPLFLEEIDYLGKPMDSLLPSDFTLFFIETEPGKFIKDDYIMDLPICDRYSHGLSRGIAISKERNLAIFWIDVW